LQFSVTGKDGVFELKPVVMNVFDGRGSGSLKADFNGSAPLYQVRCSLAKFHIEDFLQALSLNKVAEGPLDFSANLTIRGESGGKTMRSTTGEASPAGEEPDADRHRSRPAAFPGRVRPELQPG